MQTLAATDVDHKTVIKKDSHIRQDLWETNGQEKFRICSLIVSWSWVHSKSTLCGVGDAYAADIP